MSAMRVLRRLAVLSAMLAALLVWAAPASALERDAFEPASYSPFGPPSLFSHPTGIAVNETTGEVLVADGGSANVVDVFGPEGGSVLGTLTGTGSETFEFGSVSAGVAVNNDSASPSFGDVYVSDGKHGVVDKFERTGPAAYKYVCQLNGWYGPGEEACHSSGGAPGEHFIFPLGAAVDVQGNVYIASFEPERGAIDEFDSAGRGVMQVKGTEANLLSGHPSGVAVDPTGDIFVQDFSGEEHGAGELKRSSLTGGVASEESIAKNATAVAVDDSTANLYVDFGSQLTEYLSLGLGELEFGSEFGGGILSESLGVAVDSATHTIYATDAGNEDVSAFVIKPIVLPDIKGTCQVSAVTAEAATLAGEVNPLGEAGASYTIEYGLSGYEHQTGGELSGTGFMPVSAHVEGLTPGSTYHCRISATDTEAGAHGAVNHGPDGTFETLPLPPIVNESPPTASEVSTEGAVFHGVVNPNHGSTTYHFAYGLKAHDYTQSLPGVGIGCGGEGSAEGCGTTPVAVEQASSPPGGLQPGTVYHFALIATNAGGTTVGEDEIFRTPPAGAPPAELPIVSTGPAVAVGANGATLEGLVYAEGLATTYEFEIGFEAGGTVIYSTALFGNLGPESSDPHVSQEVGGLQPGRVYHYRLLAFNSAGVSEGPDRTFTTATIPTGIVQPITPGLIPTPVFPPVKYPKPTPKKHHKVRKRGKPKKKAHKARRARVRRRA